MSGQPTAGEDGPGDAEVQHIGGGVAGDEDMFVPDAEIDGVSGIGGDIAETQAGDGAAALFVLFGAIGVEEGVAVGVGSLDIGAADAIAGDGFCVPACAGLVEGMAVSDEQGDEYDVVCIWGEVVEAQFAADLVAFGNGEANVNEGA